MEATIQDTLLQLSQLAGGSRGTAEGGRGETESNRGAESGRGGETGASLPIVKEEKQGM